MLADEMLEVIDEAKVDKKMLKMAMELGKKAFKAGINAPALDPEYIKMTKGMKVGSGAAELGKAWLKGWTMENLK